MEFYVWNYIFKIDFIKHKDKYDIFIAMLGFKKEIKKKNTKENNFLMFDFTMKNTKEKQIKI